jgi:hypothetical protein
MGDTSLCAVWAGNATPPHKQPTADSTQYGTLTVCMATLIQLFETFDPVMRIPHYFWLQILRWTTVRIHTGSSGL